MQITKKAKPFPVYGVVMDTKFPNPRYRVPSKIITDKTIAAEWDDITADYENVYEIAKILSNIDITKLPKEK